MKKLLFLFAALFILGCGGEELEERLDIINVYGIDGIDVLDTTKTANPEPLTRDDTEPRLEVVDKDMYDGTFARNGATIKWEVSVDCGKTIGNPTLEFYSKESGAVLGTHILSNSHINISVSCIEGHEVCWGAWIDKENFSWGCGKNCTDSVPSWYCAYCYDDSFAKNIHLNCGGV